MQYQNQQKIILILDVITLEAQRTGNHGSNRRCMSGSYYHNCQNHCKQIYGEIQPKNTNNYSFV